MAYQPRHYRRFATPPGLVAFEVVVSETDLLVHAQSDLSDLAVGLALAARRDIAEIISRVPRFAESFVPLDLNDGTQTPPIVREMSAAASAAGVGPMAAVAGAVAEYVARGLAVHSAEVIVENGGDIYLIGSRDRTISVWAGERGAAGLGVRLEGSALPLSVATSSGTIGPSVSLGAADTATVIAESGALADAAASAVGNRVRSAHDIETALEVARGIDGVLGAVVTIAGAMGAWGQIELVPVTAIGEHAG